MRAHILSDLALPLETTSLALEVHPSRTPNGNPPASQRIALPALNNRPGQGSPALRLSPVSKTTPYQRRQATDFLRELRKPEPSLSHPGAEDPICFGNRADEEPSLQSLLSMPGVIGMAKESFRYPCKSKNCSILKDRV